VVFLKIKMLCKISDLIVEVPSTGNMYKRCADYIISDKSNSADIIIRADLYNFERWPGLHHNDIIYLESGFQFYYNLLMYNGLMLHSSAIDYDGKAYLFSGPSGRGKSTHANLWKQIYGEKVQIINDDKPALRRIDGKWYVYGTPWCGKDGINQNKKVPLGGICFLKRGTCNKIRVMDTKNSVHNIMEQTNVKTRDINKMNNLFVLVDHLIREIPIFELECLPNEEAAVLSSTTMCRAAQEKNL